MSSIAGRFALLSASIAGFVSVAGGAFGAHALEGRLDPDLLRTFETGARYLGLHALALLGVGVLARIQPSRALEWSARAYALGCVLFTGSLWALALSGVRWLGAITPLGGLCFLTGWLLLGRAASGAAIATPPGSRTPGSS